MSNQKYRSAKTPEGTVIFPFPPIKGKKWLIKVKEDQDAKDIIQKLSQGNLEDPLNSPEDYINLGVHSDGQTPVFQIPD